jgi:hypothetical protein
VKCFSIEYHIKGIKKENSNQFALETFCAKWNIISFPEVLLNIKPSDGNMNKGIKTRFSFTFFIIKYLP